MTEPVPIRKTDGVETTQTQRSGIHLVKVTDSDAAGRLSWDRYVRLKAAADESRKLGLNSKHLLDIGGYDGAIALFLPDYCVHLLDPVTTGASILHPPVEDKSYELVTAIDVLEHIPPSDRQTALTEMARISSRFIVLNYPCSRTTKAQELVYQATNNALIQEHVEWALPDTEEVISIMSERGFTGKVVAHSSLAVWVGQYLTLHLAPQAAADLNRYLIENHADEPFSVPLYHLIVLERIS